jgi:hypothetical protein
MLRPARSEKRGSRNISIVELLRRINHKPRREIFGLDRQRLPSGRIPLGRGKVGLGISGYRSWGIGMVILLCKISQGLGYVFYLRGFYVDRDMESFSMGILMRLLDCFREVEPEWHGDNFGYRVETNETGYAYQEKYSSIFYGLTRFWDNYAQTLKAEFNGDIHWLVDNLILTGVYDQRGILDLRGRTFETSKDILKDYDCHFGNANNPIVLDQRILNSLNIPYQNFIVGVKSDQFRKYNIFFRDRGKYGVYVVPNSSIVIGTYG